MGAHAVGALAGVVVAVAAAVLSPLATAQESGSANAPDTFSTPFLQVTVGIPACQVPAPPRRTAQEALAESHYRAERGTSCYQSGRCRLPNAYLYDEEIIPRAKKAILADGRFINTSVWVEGQRRWVWLRGCVADSGQAAALAQLVRSMDDVEAVINQLSVSGTSP